MLPLHRLSRLFSKVATCSNNPVSHHSVRGFSLTRWQHAARARRSAEPVFVIGNDDNDYQSAQSSSFESLPAAVKRRLKRHDEEEDLDVPTAKAIRKPRRTKAPTVVEETEGSDALDMSSGGQSQRGRMKANEQFGTCASTVEEGTPDPVPAKTRTKLKGKKKLSGEGDTSSAMLGSGTIPNSDTTKKGRCDERDKPQRSAKGRPMTKDVQFTIEPTPTSTNAETKLSVDTESLSPAETLIEQQLEKALEDWAIPDSPLAWSVFRNWKRFPDCIVLTKVGKFYEAHYSAAPRLTNIIDIKLAMRSQKVRERKGQKVTSLQFPFAGFPYTHLDKYLKILVNDLGHTVVLVEELGDEADPKYKLKNRKVGRVVTPGTLLDESWLDPDENRYLLSIAVSGEQIVGRGPNGSSDLGLWLAYTDVSTGEFSSKQSTLGRLEDELTRISPREVILDRSFKDHWSRKESLSSHHQSGIDEMIALLRILGLRMSFADTYTPPTIDYAELEAANAPDEALSLEAQAISILRHHLRFALREHSPDLARPDRQSDSAHMHIDSATLIGLEIRHSVRTGDNDRVSPISTHGTLLSVIDKTVTASGHRLLVRTLCAPLTSVPQITSRHALVQAFVSREDLRIELQETLKPLKDIMRLVQRLKQFRGDVDDVWETGSWIRGIKRIADRIRSEVSHDREHNAQVGITNTDEDLDRLDSFVNSLRPLDDIATEIEGVIRGEIVTASRKRVVGSQSVFADEDDDDALDLRSDLVENVEELEDLIEEEEDFPEGMTKANRGLLATWRAARLAAKQQWWIDPEHNQPLRDLHAKLAIVDQKLDDMREDIRRRFAVEITQLVLLTEHEKLGYAVLVSKPALRQQMIRSGAFHQAASLTKGARYLIYEPYTRLAFSRRVIMNQLQQEQQKVYRELRQKIVDLADDIQHNANLVNELDLCMGFARTAAEMGYCRPRMTDGSEFRVVNGRHPVVEAALHSTARLFVPNTTDITPENHLHIITGPNQGGKSTLLRQTAITAILAQSGSFVPADEAEIGVVDQMFSRIGARDDLFRDRSTFMLEMVETATILRDATKRSLVIMDEIGRGTTLQAGMAIAYATLDYILERIGCRTLFATHYHELETMLKVRDDHGDVKDRKGIEYWCTDVDDAEGAVSYSYRLKPGINYNSHAILAARMAGMPSAFMEVARSKMAELQGTDLTRVPRIPANEGSVSK